MLLWMIVCLWSAQARTPEEPALLRQGRVEIDLDRGEDWEVVPAGADGLALIGRLGDGRTLLIEHLDTDLGRTWTTEWTAEVPVNLVAHDVADGSLWLALHTRRKKGIVLLHCDLETGDVQVHAPALPVPVRDVRELVVDGDDLYLLAAKPGLQGGKGHLLHLRPDGAEPSVVQVPRHLGVRKVWFQRVGHEPTSGGVDLVVTSHPKKPRTLSVLRLEEGAISGTLRLGPDPASRSNLLTAQRVSTHDGDLVLGTYAGSRRGLGAQGMFVARFDGAAERFRSSHSFGDLDDFFGYRSDRAKDRLAKKAERKQAKGGELRMSVALSVADVVVTDERFLVIAEAFAPVYNTVTYTTTSVANGVTTVQTHTVLVFVGWRPTHGIVVAFSHGGDRLWDTSFELGGAVRRDLDPRMRVTVDGDRVAMLYPKGRKILTRIVEGDQVVSDDAKQRLTATDGKVKAADVEAAWWFDDAFLLWGNQTVKDDQGKRRVFAFERLDPRSDLHLE